MGWKTDHASLLAIGCLTDRTMMQRMPHHRISEAHEMGASDMSKWQCGGHNSCE
jgi:hypothetical protein